MEISIIIPIYNSEKYIEKCILSVLNQSFTDFELILVNDGSTDNSLNIIKDFESNDPRIKVCDQANSGVSSARNRGLELASGRYVTFMDSDDYVEPDYLETLYSKTGEDIDYVFSGMIYVTLGAITKKINHIDYLWDLSKEVDFLQFLMQPIQTSPCSKLYLNNIIKNHNIKFNTTLSFAEDKDFNLKFFNYVKIAVSSSYSGYYYRIDVANSLSKKKHSEVFTLSCIHWEMKKNMCKERSFFGESAKKQLVNELYAITNDELVNLSVNQSNLKMAFSSCKKDFSKVDFEFLKTWKHLISAPLWQKKLLINKRYFLLIIINRLYIHGQKKG